MFTLVFTYLGFCQTWGRAVSLLNGNFNGDASIHLKLCIVLNLDIRIAGSSCRPQLQTRDCNTVEALTSGHPWDAEKVPVTVAGGRLRALTGM